MQLLFRIGLVLPGVLATVLLSAAGVDDADQVREKLVKAKADYEAEMAKYRKEGAAWFDKREEAARKDGNKKLVDQIKVERTAFEEKGNLPKVENVLKGDATDLARLSKQKAMAQTGLVKAYEFAIRDYTKANKDKEAAAVEKELVTFKQRGGAVADESWTALFNGKDLTGWRIHPNPNPGAYAKTVAREEGGKVVAFEGETKDGKRIALWTVKDGTLVGSGPHSHLFTVKDDYADFHYRVEAKINDKGNSGQYFRTEFGPGFPKGYEAQINATHTDQIRTGSLYPSFGKLSAEDRAKILVMKDAPHKADEFFVQEVIAEGNHIQIFVNGKKTVDFTDPNNTYKKGCFALQGHDPGTVVTFKKIEWKPITK